MAGPHNGGKPPRESSTLKQMIPTFQSGFLNDLGIELGLRWHRLESLMFRSRAERHINENGETMNLWAESVYAYRADMYAYENRNALVCLISKEEKLEISVTASEALPLVEAFIDSCSIMCAASDPLPKLRKAWGHLNPEIKLMSKVEHDV